jgi:hypothetical protein
VNGTSTQENKTFDQDRAARTSSLYLSGRSSSGSANTAAAQIDALAASLSGDVDNWSGQAQGFGENPNSPIASRTISLGSDGIFNLGDGRYQLPSGRIAGVSTQLVSIDNNASSGDQSGFLYKNSAGDLVRGSGVGEVFNGLENNTNYAVPGAAQYQPSGGLRYTFDSTGTAFWRAGDQILSIPLPFDRPSLAGLQASSFWDGAKNAPGALVDGLSDLINGRVDFSNITARSFTEGLIRNSPIGILSTAAFDSDYKAAGERSGGLVIGGVGGFGARLAAPAVARGVTATAQWVAPVAARYLETYTYRTGISSYIVPPGAANTFAGTLERGNISANIVGGVPENYVGHHLIGIVEANNYPALHRAAELGYNINRGSNGIALPNTIEEAMASGLPLHTGRHLGAYTDFVDSQLSRLQNRYDLGRIPDAKLGQEIGKVENTIREALLNKQIRLQNLDPHF